MTRLRFRAWKSNEAQLAEVRNIGARKSFQADPVSLARAVLSGQGLESITGLPSIDLGEFEHWDKNGWGDSLPFYLATLDQSYWDADSNYKQTHEQVLSSYSKEESIPTETLPDASCPAVELPAAEQVVSVSRGAALGNRRTTLVPKQEKLSLQNLSDILWEATRRLAAFRVGAIADDPKRAMVNFGPSLDLYVVAYDVEQLDKGIFRYDLERHRLIQVNGLPRDLRKQMRDVLVGQPASMTAAVTVVYVSDIIRHQWRYRHPRALRGLWIDSAKVVNELLWSLSARGIVPHMTPAVNDTKACEIMALPPTLDIEDNVCRVVCRVTGVTDTMLLTNRALLRYAGPMALSSIGAIVVGLTDTLIMGHYSTNALAGVALGASIYELPVNALLGGLMAYRILAPRIASKERSGRSFAGLRLTLKGLAPWAAGALVVLLLVASAMTTAGTKTESESLVAAGQYLLGRSPSLLAEALSTALVITLVSWGRAKVPLGVFAISSGVNLVLDFVLVYGVGPLPPMGALGDGYRELSRGCRRAALADQSCPAGGQERI